MRTIIIVASILALCAAARAAALDDKWTICQRHRVLRSDHGAKSITYESGFEACSDVETQFRAMSQAAKQSQSDADKAALQRLNGQ